MKKALLFALPLAYSLTLPGCLIPHRFSDADTDTDSNGNATSGAEDTQGPGQTSSLPGPDGDWPPSDGFDPIPDIGDGTLSEDMLVVIELPQGRMTMWFYAERPGYGIVGHFQDAVPAAPGQMPLWVPAGQPMDIGYNGVEDNNFGVILDNYDLPDTTPLGPVNADLVFDLWLYSDRLMCGTVDIDLPAGEFIDDAPVVVWPLEDLLDPDPAFECVEP